MIPTDFPGSTGYLRPPSDMQDGSCDPLPYSHDGAFFMSMWVPDADELARLNAGQAVVLWVRGSTHPVVALGVSVATVDDGEGVR